MKFFNKNAAMLIIYSMFFANLAFAKEQKSSVVLKYGLLSGGIEADHDLGPLHVVGGADADMYVVGGFSTYFLGVKKYFTDSFYTRLSGSYVENSGEYLYGAGPGASLVLGNKWNNGNIVFGGDWIGVAAYHDNLDHEIKYYMHFPKLFLGLEF